MVSAVEIPEFYKIAVSPGEPPPLGRPASAINYGVKINNRGDFMTQETFNGRRTVTLGHRVPGVVAGYRYPDELGTLRGVDLHGLLDGQQAENADPGDIRDTSLETYFTSPVEAVGTSRGTWQLPRRRAMSWSVSGTTVSRIDLGVVGSFTESVALGANTFTKNVGFNQNVDGGQRTGHYKSDLSSAPLTMTLLSNPNYGEGVAINESGLIVGRNGARASFWNSSSSVAIIDNQTNDVRNSRLVSVSNVPLSGGTLPRAVGYYFQFGTAGEYFDDSIADGFVTDLTGGYRYFASATPSAINDGGVIVFQYSSQNTTENRIWFPNAQNTYDASGVRFIGQAGSLPFLEPIGNWVIRSIQDINNSNQIVGSVVDNSNPPAIRPFVGTAIYTGSGSIKVPVSFEGIDNLDNAAYAADHPSIWYRMYQGQILIEPETDQSTDSSEALWKNTASLEKVGNQYYLTITGVRLRGLVTLLLRPTATPIGDKDKARYLTKTILVNATSGLVTASAIEFLSGDIDRDNAISVFDYDILSQDFDINSSDTGWNTAGSSGHCPRECDFDEDGSISVFDYDLLSRNYDKRGEVY